MKNCKNDRRLSGGALIFAMFLAMIISVGIPQKVYAVENKPLEYKVTQEGVTPSNGAVEWSKQGDIVTIKLKGNLLGMITIDEGGSYIFDAGGYTIFPGKNGDTNRQNNAIDGNFSLYEDIELTIKGEGKYYSGTHHVIYLQGSRNKNLYIENGIFYDDDIMASNIYIDKVGNDNVYLFKANANDPQEYTEKTKIDIRNYGAFMVKQGTISDEDKAYVQNVPNPECLDYFLNPVQQDSNPSNPNPSNPNEGETIPNTNQSTSDTHTHNFQWVVTKQPTEKTDGCNSLMCTSCGAVEATQPISYFNNITNNVMKEINDAPNKGTITIEDEFLRCFSNEMVEELLARPDLTVVVNFTDKGVNYSFTIPAGKAPTDGQEWYGYYYLGSVYGWTLMENVK